MYSCPEQMILLLYSQAFRLSRWFHRVTIRPSWWKSRSKVFWITGSLSTADPNNLALLFGLITAQDFVFHLCLWIFISGKIIISLPSVWKYHPAGYFFFFCKNLWKLLLVILPIPVDNFDLDWNVCSFSYTFRKRPGRYLPVFFIFD